MCESITVALEPYDRHLPLVERSWKTDEGTSIDVVLVGQLADHWHGRNRHERFLHHREFDVAEMSLSSYLVYRQQNRDLIALPIFPRRMFSFSNVWVRRDSHALSWLDIRSGVIGVPTFQMSLGVVARREMGVVENVNWRDFTWATAHDEALPLDTATIRIEASDLETALLRGEVDAILTPEIPSGDAFVSGCRRLYGSRAKEIEQRLLLDQRYAPIVHLLVAQRSVLERCPRLEQSLTRVFSRAYDIAWERYNDPAWSLQFWGRQEFEQQRNLIGRDCWSQGLEPNSRALRDFCDAAADQGIIGHVPALSDLFA